MDYNEKAEMILNKSAVMLDDGNVVMISAKHFNEYYTPAISKQIPSPVNYTELFKTKYFVCQSCGTYSLLHTVLPKYCSYCGQRLIFKEDEDE